MKAIKSISVILLSLLIVTLCACSAVENVGEKLGELVSELNDLESGIESGAKNPDGIPSDAETPDPTAESPSSPAPDPLTPAPSSESASDSGDDEKIDENGTYTSKDDVALYIKTYGRLPSNFITKKQAEQLGWSGGSLEPYAPGKSIGGDYFGNYEKILPVKSGRRYTECDIDTLGARSRGAKRIVFSNDGLIYYTEDHYETFVLLYGEDGK